MEVELFRSVMSCLLYMYILPAAQFLHWYRLETYLSCSLADSGGSWHTQQNSAVWRFEFRRFDRCPFISRFQFLPVGNLPRLGREEATLWLVNNHHSVINDTRYTPLIDLYIHRRFYIRIVNVLSDHCCGKCSLCPNFSCGFGWNPGEKLYKWLGKKFKDATRKPDITFTEVQ